ncbi:hypothetical protein [Streptomyces alanosinicus]|uniref:Uncharacterized protein n=1 Tax=Streptomyces alanosinicus TaxID=68171 RepID=A0A919D807_9ACTN|nr:hypothetical protein [Streptomyces alanosinicus]GHE15305.1 hypothetical protein GCM10010339_89520 [Streptomyces alanosinicus]
MGADAEFTFSMSQETPVPDFVTAAEAAGWRFEDGESLAYVTDADLFDWLTAAKSARGEVVRELESVRLRGQACGFIMTHREDDAGCIFIVTDSGKSLLVTPNKNVVQREGLERFTDGEWYLGKLLSMFTGLPLVAYSHSQELT